MPFPLVGMDARARRLPLETFLNSILATSSMVGFSALLLQRSQLACVFIQNIPSLLSF